MQDELMDFIICPKCGKRNTPESKTCWNCKVILYPEEGVEYIDPKEQQAQMPAEPVEEPEIIKACELNKMNFMDRMFAHSLLFRGEMLLEFCGCEDCRKIHDEMAEFFKDVNPELFNEKEIKGKVLDLSVFGL